jgi:hypothetical protein
MQNGSSHSSLIRSVIETAVKSLPANQRAFLVNIDRSTFLAFVTSLAGGAVSVVACGGAPVPAQTVGTPSDTAAPATPVPAAPALASAAAAPGPSPTPAPSMAQAPATAVSPSGLPADAPAGAAPGATDAPATPTPSALDAVDATGPAPGVVAGVDVLGVRIGMPISEATAVLKAKGLTVHPCGECPADYSAGNVLINVMKTTPAPLVREVWQGDQKKMFASDVASALRAKYGGSGIDSGAVATKGFSRPTRESCSKTLDARASCRVALAAKKDVNPQHMQACADDREQSCNTYPTADQKPQTQGGHAIIWYYDEHGHPLSLEGYQRYCPTGPDCRAIVVSTHFGDPDGAGTIGGYEVRLVSQWLLKRDNDEQHRRQVEAQKDAERKQREEEINVARKNKPTL